MNTIQLFFTYIFASNIVIILLSGIQDALNYPIEQNFGLKNLWLKKGPHIIFWGIAAKLINIILPINSFFLPVFILLYLLIRIIEYNGLGRKSEKSELEPVLVDPVLIIPILIAGYVDISILDLIILYCSIWLGLGLGLLILLSVRSKIELLQKHNSSVLLISCALIAMIFSFMQYIIPL